MSEAAETPDGEDAEPKKKSKLPLIIGLVLALAGGGGGFFAVYSGLLFGSDAAHSDEAHEGDSHGEAEAVNIPDMPNVDFVAVEPMLISLAGSTDNTALRFRAQLEVVGGHQAEVEKLLPRVVDVLNSYLRALDVADLEDRAALSKLRAQMLRRVQIVTGPGRVSDLLIMEFVLNKG